jgi:putative ABC transport system permease protein
MNPLSTLRIAFIALFRNKLRSFLTALGIIIGVAAVIAMMSIGEGAKQLIIAQFSAMGANLIMVVPGASTSGGARGGAGSASSITWDDLKAIQAQVPTVVTAAPVLRQNAMILAEEQNWMSNAVGTTPDYFTIRSWPMARGRALTESDVESGTKVAILGQTVVDKLYGPNADPVGQTVRIRNIPFEVVGIAGSKGQSPNGQDFDDTVIIPVTTFQSKLQGGLRGYISGTIMITASAPDTVTRTVNDVSDLLRERHHVRPGEPNDFQIRNLAEMASAQQEGTETLTTLLASVAAVSLLVGGIGIMNIMLVSVTERTREIGVRMAVGAKPRNILAQFLVEALTLSIAGGLLGVGIGIYAAGQLAAQFEWPMLLRPDIVVISVGFSALVGVVFGLYPARKASQLDPIEALRAE